MQHKEVTFISELELLNDTNVVKVLDMQDLDASNNVRMVMRFTSAVQFGIASDLVEYA